MAAASAALADERLTPVFAALADPVRRAMVARLADGDATVTELAEPHGISMQAISKHVKVLEAAGQVVNVTDLLALDVPDRAGGLASVLEVFEKTGLGVEYMYAFGLRERGKSATLLFRLEDPDAAAVKLAAAGISLVSAEELLRRANA